MASGGADLLVSVAVMFANCDMVCNGENTVVPAMMAVSRITASAYIQRRRPRSLERAFSESVCSRDQLVELDKLMDVRIKRLPPSL